MSTISFDPRSFHTGQPRLESIVHENIEAGDCRQLPLCTSENRRNIVKVSRRVRAAGLPAEG